MGILEIVKYPDPRLKQPCERETVFDSSLHKLLDDMRDTMYEAEGIGLAAPQVGVLKRIAVVDVSQDRDGVIELINPEITWSEGKVPSEEGCLSIPDYRETISRNENIKVTAQDRNGKEFELEASEILAICIQHEIDHLNGILFVDRLSRLKREFFRRWLKKQK
jgi:peptide deformylase